MLQDKINEHIKAAMFTLDKERLVVLRTLKTALSNAALQSGNINKPLDDLEVIATIRKQIKSREDSVRLFTEARRLELAEKEQWEISVLETYLPQPLTDEEINKIINSAINTVQATSKREMGKVMKLALEACGGRVDNKTLSAKIGAKLI